MNHWLVVGVGLLAQALFSSRLLVQWIASERSRKVVSPVLFWQLSLLASLLLCLYGWLRRDVVIILGQLISYYIYIWNLDIKGAWKIIPTPLRILALSIPAVAVLYCGLDWRDTLEHLFYREELPLGLIIFGMIGQLTFTLRFVYQWWYSRRQGESLLPAAFWMISLTGSLLIVTYAIIRTDWVLILGQASGAVVYGRNLFIGRRAAISSEPEPDRGEAAEG